MLTATDDHTAVQFDARTGDTTLVGDFVDTGLLAAQGEGQANTELASSVAKNLLAYQAAAGWSPDGVLEVLRSLAEQEAEFLKKGYVRLSMATKTEGWFFDSAPAAGFGLFETNKANGQERFVDSVLFRKIAKDGLEGAGLREVKQGYFKIVIDVPPEWTDVQTAEYVIDVLKGTAGNGKAGLKGT